jgi:glycosyltransferase involved in cell wall biosynthesis
MDLVGRISIITVNYNDKDGLQRTIESVISQSYKNTEFIVIDGGSTDGSKSVIEKYENHITFWVSEEDEGIYHAMNKGIRKSKGSHLFFLNSGDEFSTPFALESLSSARADIIYGNVTNVLGEKRVEVKYPARLRASFLFYTTICHQALLISRRTFEVVGLYDESLKIASDWKFLILALCRHNFTYTYVDANISFFYLGGISSNKKYYRLLIEEREKVIHEEFPLFVEDYKLQNKLALYRYRLRYLNPINVIRRILEGR